MTIFKAGWGSGFLGVLIFSGSLPATRLAVVDLTPMFLTASRAVIATLIGVALLTVTRQPLPSRRDLASLALVALGVVVGFPLLTALALRHITSARSLVFIALLPLATALFAVWRAGERPKAGFWGFSTLGAAIVMGFTLAGGGGVTPDGGALIGDALMIAAIVVCGFGYAEGATLTRRLGGWQVISWALALAAPLMIVLMVVTWPASLADVAWPSWAGLAYVSVFSMMVGFIFWYRGLALGGIARVGQLQSLQPFMGLALAGLVLGEPVSASMVLAAVAVVSCVALARKHA